ncbi:hypothetical protein OJF2_72490 [Aquisphaera giovannonii]|uniref:Uncharacterized protein n=1 Tax=Aquisphaera giovannonii TaxID=406548 RepID=A0A5B9WDV6_9BACT|nr:hypothetical protein [Aquisphaera giovannonii]QEH38643.1 hypothetical protein OJF2_72490 [Aquisphaera giovannonii]
MRDERTLRRATFTDGPRVVLGDGQAWAFPRPWLRLYPVRGEDGRLAVGGGMSYGAEYEDLVDRLVECGPDDRSGRLAVQFQMAADLLGRNYELDDRDLRRLLAVDLADPACEARWEQINQVLLGQPPKPSADGSATP